MTTDHSVTHDREAPAAAAAAVVPSRRRLLLTVAVPVLVVLLAVLAVVVRPWGQRAVALPDLGTAPSYTLTDHRGATVASDDFDGRVQVVTYLFPYCTTYCPYITRQLVELEQRLVADGYGDRVAFVGFNLAAADSDLAHMTAYLEQYGADPEGRWWFLTGAQPDVDVVVRDGFGVLYERVPLEDGHDHPHGSDAVDPQDNPVADEAAVDYDVLHNDLIHVVGPDGVVRGVFDRVAELTDEELYDGVVAVLDATA